MLDRSLEKVVVVLYEFLMSRRLWSPNCGLGMSRVGVTCGKSGGRSFGVSCTASIPTSEGAPGLKVAEIKLGCVPADSLWSELTPEKAGYWLDRGT